MSTQIVYPFGSVNGVRNSQNQWNPSDSATFIDYFARTFKFSRGSLQFQVMPNGDLSSSTERTELIAIEDVAKDVHPTETPQAISVPLDFGYENLLWPCGARAINNAQYMPAECVIPFYSQQYFYNNTYREVGTVPAYHYNTMPAVRMTTSNLNILLKSAGEDFQYGFMIGPPPITYSMFIEPLI